MFQSNRYNEKSNLVFTNCEQMLDGKLIHTRKLCKYFQRTPLFFQSL